MSSSYNDTATAMNMKLVPSASRQGLLRRSGQALDTLNNQPSSMTPSTASTTGQTVLVTGKVPHVQYYQITSRPRFQQTNMNVLIANLIEGISSVVYFEQLLAQHGAKSAKINSVVINNSMNTQLPDPPTSVCEGKELGTTDTITSQRKRSSQSHILLRPPQKSLTAAPHRDRSNLNPCRQLVNWFRQMQCSYDCRAEGTRAQQTRQQQRLREDDIHRVTRDMWKTVMHYNNDNSMAAITHPPRLGYSSKTSAATPTVVVSSVQATARDTQLNKEYTDFMWRCRHTALPLLIDRPCLFESLQTRVSSVTDFAFFDTVRCVLEAAYSATGADRLLTVIAAGEGSYMQFQDFYITLLSYAESQSLATGPSAAGSYCSDPQVSNNRTNTILYATSCPGIITPNKSTSIANTPSTDYHQHLMSVLSLATEENKSSTHSPLPARSSCRSHSVSKQITKTAVTSYTHSHDYDITKASLDFTEYNLDMEYISQVSVDLSRNLRGFAFPSTIDRKQRRYVEFILQAACRDLASELSSSYSFTLPRVSCHYLSLSEITLLPEALQQHLDRFDVNYYCNNHAMTDTSSFYLAGEIFTTFKPVCLSVSLCDCYLSI